VQRIEEAKEPNVMTSIAILGANGRLAHAAALAFDKAGYAVIAVTRSGRAAGLPATIRQRTADATDRQSLIRATEGADIIFNGLNAPYPAWHRLVMPMGENVMAAARHHGAMHLFPGNVYNYGRAIPALVDNDTAFEATTRKGAIRIQLETLFQEHAARHGVRSAILRAGDFYGGSVPGSWFDVIVAAKIGRRRFTYPGPTDVIHSWAYLPDLAAAFVALAEHRHDLSAFETFLFSGHALTGEEMQRCCEAALGESLTRAGVPWPLLRLAGLVSPMMREVCEMAYLWDRPHRLDGAKLEALLGTDPRLAVSQALAAIGVDMPTSRADTLASPV